MLEKKSCPEKRVRAGKSSKMLQTQTSRSDAAILNAAISSIRRGFGFKNTINSGVRNAEKVSAFRIAVLGQMNDSRSLRHGRRAWSPVQQDELRATQSARLWYQLLIKYRIVEPELLHHREAGMGKQKVRIKHHSGLGLVWFAGWLFTIGFLELSFWKGVFALLVWPYYLGVALALLNGEPPQPVSMN